MAEIPSDIVSSAAGAPLQSREVSKETAARRAGQAHAASTQVRALDDAASIVETTDDDTRVFADAEGGGSQGRESQSDEAGRGQEADDARKGIVQGEDGQLHIDLEA